VIALSVYVIGCQPRTQSLIDPTKKVAVVEFNREIVTLQARLIAKQAALTQEAEALAKSAEIGKADLQAQTDKLTAAVETIGATGQALITGTFTPAAGVSAAVTMASIFLGAGSYADKRRTDKVLAQKKAAPDSA